MLTYCYITVETGNWYILSVKNTYKQIAHARLTSTSILQCLRLFLDVNRMTLEDFCRFYNDLDICCLCPDFLDGSSSCHWKTSFYEGRWVAGTTAGGCMNNFGTFRISALKPPLFKTNVTCHLN